MATILPRSRTGRPLACLNRSGKTCVVAVVDEIVGDRLDAVVGHQYRPWPSPKELGQHCGPAAARGGRPGHSSVRGSRTGLW
ncbi:hypothetical protein AB5J52_32215 [Streptomyces sp. R39]|uniref:Uncharacterized protein n=1 Tax=Streptomyces sp. R39 TaxID=3238631 RepID=A0AB39QWE3_9ACTN